MNATRNIALGFFALATLLLGTGPTPAPAIDLNGDGLSDIWQQIYGISPGDIASDPDGDGASNLLENRFRTNPNLNGAPNIHSDMFGTIQVSVQGTDFEITWPTQIGVRYQLERSVDLETWASITLIETGDGALFVATDMNPFQTETKYLYRLLSNEPLDGDGDFLDAWEEAALGLDDSDDDVDNDGLRDGTEWILNLDPDDPDSDNDMTDDGDEDSDGDGVTNAYEDQNGLNPASIDSDNDGVADGYEIAVSTDPLIFDSAYQAPGPLGLLILNPPLR